MSKDYEMYSPAGNQAVERLVNALKNNVANLDTSEKLYSFVNDGLKKISEKHDEVYDTEPRYHIEKEANKIAQYHGYEELY